MKKQFFILILLFVACRGFSQNITLADDTPEYIRLGIIPEFIVYKAPDSTLFTEKNIRKRKPSLLMIFSPDCGHCQHETTVLLQNISHFRKTQIFMFTWLPFSDMMTFYKNYKIANYPEITMAWDPKFFFLPYYHVGTYPMLIAYDKKGHLVKTFSGNINIEDVWKALGQD